MIILKTAIALKEWGNRQGVQLPIEVTKAANFSGNPLFLKVEIVNGAGRIIIEEEKNSKELSKMADETLGILAQRPLKPVRVTDKSYRTERRLKKYELLDD